MGGWRQEELLLSKASPYQVALVKQATQIAGRQEAKLAHGAFHLSWVVVVG